MIELDKDGLEDLRTALAKVNDIDNAFKVFAQAVYENAVDRADKHTITGALYKSIYLKPVDDGYIIGSDNGLAPYAKFVHNGTKPHTIVPNRRRSLRWVQKSGFVFAKTVHHPGYKGDPFIYDAIDEEMPQTEKLFERFIDGL